MADKKKTSRKSTKYQYVFLIVLILVLTGLSLCSVLLFGRTCTLEYRFSDPENVTLEYDSSIVACIGRHVSGDLLTLDFRSVSGGYTLLCLEEPGSDRFDAVPLYVHPFGIITAETYFGKCKGDILFSASIILVLLTVLLMLWRKYRESSRENLCRYVNTRLLGAVIFIAFLLALNLLSMIRLNRNGSNPSVLQLLEQTLSSSNLFSMLLLPLALIISLAISISNLILMKREGIGLRNMLGFFLGIFLCIGTVAPDMVYPLLDRLGMNVHQYSSPAVLFSNYTENAAAIVMAYFECILLGTAFSAVRAARHIPQFDKDCILILGCQIKKDGTLTKLLQSRADRAIEFARMQKEKTGKDIIFVPSGGKGSDEVIAEAEAIRNYLISSGIPEHRILTENNSKNTEENIRFSDALIKERIPDGKTAFSTTNYHVFRAGCFAEEAGIPMEGIGAKTKTYFWINAFIREFIASLHYEKKKHIRNLLLILFLLLPFEIVVYLSRM